MLSTLDFYTQDGQALVRQELVESLLFFYVKWKKGYFEFKSVLNQTILKKQCHWWIWKLIPLKLSRIRIKASLEVPALLHTWTPTRQCAPHRSRAESRAMCPELLCFLGAKGFRSPRLLFFEFAQNSVFLTKIKPESYHFEEKTHCSVWYLFNFYILFLSHCCLTDWILLTTRSPVLKKLPFACQQILDECQRYNLT